LENEDGTVSPAADLDVQVPLVFLNANERKFLSKLDVSHPETFGARLISENWHSFSLFGRKNSLSKSTT